jgi:hypothetical protein
MVSWPQPVDLYLLTLKVSYHRLEALGRGEVGLAHARTVDNHWYATRGLQAQKK